VIQVAKAIALRRQRVHALIRADSQRSVGKLYSSTQTFDVPYMAANRYNNGQIVARKLDILLSTTTGW
jgi:hypothetical protein